jgi:hypothetical protein
VCLSFCHFSFGHCVVCPSSTYGLWLPLWCLLVIVLSVLPRLTACNYLFGIFWSLCCLSFLDLRLVITSGIFWSLCCLSFLDLRLVITSLVSFGHCIVCPSSTYGLWLPLWYPLVIVSSVLPRLAACGYLSGVGLHKFHCNFLPWNIYIVLIVGSHLNDYLKLNFSYIVVFLCFSFDW